MLNDNLVEETDDEKKVQLKFMTWVVKGVLLGFEGNRALQVQNANQVASVSSALGRCGGSSVVTTTQGRHLSIKAVATAMFQDHVTPKISDNIWWLILDNSLSDLLHSKYVDTHFPVFACLLFIFLTFKC